MILWRIALAISIIGIIVLSPCIAGAFENNSSEMNAAPEAAEHKSADEKQTGSIFDVIKKGFSSTIRALLFFGAQDPGNSTQNPQNAFLKLHRYSGELDLRPDFFLETPHANGVFKPRWNASYEWFEDGVMDGQTDHHGRVFVNEWAIQAKPDPSLLLSFGKEKLLWGPSFLVSPSNALFKNTEKINPMLEVEGKYLVRAVYFPNTAFTLTWISETMKNINEQQQKVHPINALKADFMGKESSASLISYFQSGGRFRLGGFGQWTVSDAVLLYYDGIIVQGTDVLYPEESPSNALGAEFIKKYGDSERIFATVAVGGSYTALSGETYSLEFLYNGEGYDDAEAKRYYDLRQNAGNHFFDVDVLSGLSQQTLFNSFNTGLPFLRKYYLMVQFSDREIKSVLDINLRYVHCLEDNTGAASSILEWKLSDRMLFFNINQIGFDYRKESEFTSVLDWSVMAGIEMHF